MYRAHQWLYLSGRIIPTDNLLILKWNSDHNLKNHNFDDPILITL